MRARKSGKSLIAWLASGWGILALPGCALFQPLPEPTTLEDRLSVFPAGELPIEKPITIHWDRHQIPFIEAEDDGDLAFAIGLVHAHLRLGQMEFIRRVASGRLAEMAGPLATDIDHSLRVLDFSRAVPASEQALPEETRMWLQRYVDGVNYYQAQVDPLPHEFAVLGLEREPWSIADVLTIGRLASTDFNWVAIFPLLKLRKRPDWPEIWQRVLKDGQASVTSFNGDDIGDPLPSLLLGSSRTGSNSFAVSARKSASGGALMANDPHVGLSVPNVWLIVGYKSPSHHAVGLMIPGVPLITIGRNPEIAWGGTNLRAASSDLVDVSNIPTDQIRSRDETVRVRWWFGRDITVRETEFGPVISDAPLVNGVDGEAFALKWTGHEPSDESTALLRASKAKDWESFREAFATHAVPGLNMLYADQAGNIGQLIAVKVPDRENGPPPDLLRPPEAARDSWQSFTASTELPYAFNPERGYLASANNRPARTDVPLGLFFAPDDRVERISELLEGQDGLTWRDLARIQQDVYQESADELRRTLLAAVDGRALTQEAERIRDLIRAWDGAYRIDSRGAVAFELFLNAFVPAFYGNVEDGQEASIVPQLRGARSLLREDIEAADKERLADAVVAALSASAPDIDKFAEWGDFHRLHVAHPMGMAPLIGGRYRFGEYPVSGSNDTLMKSAHAITGERHAARYGTNSRHISDMSDSDENYFVLLGGQDGWLNSANFLDQLPLWRNGEYVRVPLRPETVREAFPHKTQLDPAG